MDVRTVCLGVLTLGDASGYEIRKAFEEGPFQYFTDAGFGSIYPALNRLLQDGLVACTAMAQDKRPDKKVYSVTQAGRAAFAQALLRRPGPDKIRSDFMFSLFFQELLPGPMLAATIDDRIAWYRGRLADMESCDCAAFGPGPSFVNGFGRAIYGAALAFLEENRDSVSGAPETKAAE